MEINEWLNKLGQSPERSSFIFKAKEKYKNKYSYAKVKYKNMKQKVIVTCPIHGDFEVSPFKHLEGKECPKCMNCKSIDTLNKNKQKFIDKAKEIHPEYNYSKVEYINSKTKVCIICPEHGEFYVTPNNFLGKYNCGCHYCKNKATNKEEFVYKASKIHNNKYDYSQVEYTNSKAKIKIVCPEHGEFWQSPNDHLNGCGCPVCKESRGEKIITKILENYNIKYLRQYKINKLFPNKYILVDFYLPDYNLFIEYNGIQHYIPVKYFGGELKFQYQQERDCKLKEYCQNNNIDLLIIKYDVDNFNDIEQIILNRLNGNK